MKDSGNAVENAVEKIRPKVSGQSETARKTVATAAPVPAKTRGKRSEDYTGFRSSHLTAIEPVLGKDGRKDYKGYTIWRCKCDCGRFAKYESRALKSGRAKDCGDDACPYHAETIRKRYRFEDLTGKRFGKLVVIGPVMKDEQFGNLAVDNCRVAETAAEAGTANTLAIGDKSDKSDRPITAVIESKDTFANADPPVNAASLTGKSLIEVAGTAPTMFPTLPSALTEQQATVIPMTSKSQARAPYHSGIIAHDRRGQILWKCLCDCGNMVIAPGGQLRAGYRRSCGCLSHPPLKDWVGHKFGSLTVTAYAGKKGSVNYWKCRCDCGNETSVAQSSLQSGHTTSCGCLMKPPHEYRTLVDGTCVETLRAAVEHGTVFKSNRSGVRGVYWDKRNSKWTAQITFKGKTHYLGSYTSIHEAEIARKRGEDRYFGEFLEEYDSQVRGTGAV